MSYSIPIVECYCKGLVFQSHCFDLNPGITSIIINCINLTFLDKLCYVLVSQTLYSINVFLEEKKSNPIVQFLVYLTNCWLLTAS